MSAPTIDLSVEQTLAVLSDLTDKQIAVAYRNGDPGSHVQIFFRGEWHILCRTDLNDDRCTAPFLRDDESPRQFVQRLSDLCNFGARVGHSDIRTSDPPWFAVIDLWSDAG